MLHDLAEFFQSGLVFKGGTCLSKVHLDFYRLSEDLDFAISIAATATPSKRRAAIAPTRKHLGSLCERHDCFRELEVLQGHNGSRLYSGVFSYRSVVTGQEEPIKVDITLREPILQPAERQEARTLLTDPFTKDSAFAPVAVSVLSVAEAYAEKIRAALTRKEPAIRDFFDIDCAVRKGILNHLDETIVTLVRQKLLVPGTAAMDLSLEKQQNLQRQLLHNLLPWYVKTTTTALTSNEQSRSL